MTHADAAAAGLALRAPSGDEGGAARAVADPLGVEGLRLSRRRGEEIFAEGDAAASLYRVIKGAVRTYRVSADGRRQIAEIHLAGDVFGLEAGEAHRTTAEAITDCELVALRRSHLAERAMADSATGHKLWALTLHHLRRTEEHMLVLGRKGACERLAWFLIDLAERIPAANRIDLFLSRQDIADYLGLTIETVSRTLTQLQDEGVIALPSCRQVWLRDRERLARLAA